LGAKSAHARSLDSLSRLAERWQRLAQPLDLRLRQLNEILDVWTKANPRSRK